MITGRTWASLKKKLEEHFNRQLLQSQPSSPVAAHVAWQEPFVCFGLGFSALLAPLAPLAPLAMSVHSCVEFRAKKKKKLPSGLQTPVCVITLLSEAPFLNQAEGGKQKKEKTKRTRTIFGRPPRRKQTRESTRHNEKIHSWRRKSLLLMNLKFSSSFPVSSVRLVRQLRSPRI